MKRLWLNGWQCHARALTSLRELLQGDGEPLLDYSECTGTRQQWLQQQSALITEPTVLVGWSLGGMLACELAALNPSVKKVLVICANTQFAGGPGLTEAVADNFMMRYKKNAAITRKRFAALVDSQHAALVSENLLDGDHLATLQWLYDSRIASLNLNADIRVVLAENDLLVPAKSAQEAWQSSGAKVTTLAGEHSLPLTQPEQIAHWIAEHG